jgi:hypothetical protein
MRNRDVVDNIGEIFLHGDVTAQSQQEKDF